MEQVCQAVDQDPADKFIVNGEVEAMVKTGRTVKPARKRRAFDSETADRQTPTRKSPVYGGLMGRENGTVFAIRDVVDILFSIRKPPSVWFGFFTCNAEGPT